MRGGDRWHAGCGEAQLMARWSRAAFGVVLVTYAVGLGFLGGMAIERIRHDQERQVRVKREADVARRARERAMELERRVLTEHSRAMPWLRGGSEP